MGIRFILVELAGHPSTFGRAQTSGETMAVEDDLRRLSEMQAIFLSWQSFVAQLCIADSPALTTANNETCGTPQPLNQSSSQNIVHLPTRHKVVSNAALRDATANTRRQRHRVD